MRVRLDRKPQWKSLRTADVEAARRARDLILAPIAELRASRIPESQDGSPEVTVRIASRWRAAAGGGHRPPDSPGAGTAFTAAAAAELLAACADMDPDARQQVRLLYRRGRHDEAIALGEARRDRG